MTSTDNLTGHWTGHYLQSGQQRPITATLVQVGEHLNGSMRDGQELIEHSLTDITRQLGLLPGNEQLLADNLRQSFAQSPSAPIRIFSHLPSHSLLEGDCDGQSVSFIKTYQGTAFSGIQVGNHLNGKEEVNHQIHYAGQLSDDGQEIAGLWWIEPNLEEGTPRTEGEFALRRQ